MHRLVNTISEEALAKFQRILIRVQGMEYPVWITNGLELVHVLLERHRKEQLHLQYEEVEKDEGQRVFGELNTANACSKVWAQTTRL